MTARILHLEIQGRVQGVGFRAAFADEAERLGLDGWVRNRAVGSVEAVVRGPQETCDALVRWSHRGPPAARVSRVDVRPATAAEAAALAAGFRMLPSL
jgi:acylphosphatase